jgi:hypothetical protein
MAEEVGKKRFVQAVRVPFMISLGVKWLND